MLSSLLTTDTRWLTRYPRSVASPTDRVDRALLLETRPAWYALSAFAKSLTPPERH